MATDRTHGWLEAAATLLLCTMPALPALAVTDSERVAVYKEFRVHFDARQYAPAKLLAERLVELTEQQYGPDELQLSTPLTNLGTVEFKLGNYPAAIESYQRCLRILQAKSTLADKAQIRPLHGLGVAFLGANDPQSAVVALKRAADLSRNTDGLFNIGQVEFIDALIDAYAATGRYGDAEKESQYALRVEEAAYGRSSLKLLDRLEKLARWYENDRRYTSGRNAHERALAILTRQAPQNDLRRIAPLRGIARTYRLEMFYGTEGADTGGSFNSPIGAPVFSEGTQNRRAESSLAAALAVVDANTPVNPQLRGEVLADLGDWFLITNSLRRAYDTYGEAWKSFEEAGNTRYLSAPRLLAYRPSISSIDRSQLDPAEAVPMIVELHFTVDRDGKVDNVTSPTTDVPETIVRGSTVSMKRSRYAPRIENGAAVPTEDVVFREQVLVRASLLDSAAPSEKDSESETAPEDPKESESAPEPAKS